MPRFEPTKLTNLRLMDLPNGAYLGAEVPTGAGQWHRYATAYREAGDQIAEMMIEGTYERNTFGPPLLFLYRHSIELHLKSLLLDAGKLLDDPQDFPVEHYLSKLWHCVRALILRVDNRGSEWIDRADDVIEQFDAIDPHSIAFRYPVKVKGAPSLPSTLLIDPAVAKQIVAELFILLDGVSIQISEYQGYKYEGLY